MPRSDWLQTWLAVLRCCASTEGTALRADHCSRLSLPMRRRGSDGLFSRRGQEGRTVWQACAISAAFPGCARLGLEILTSNAPCVIRKISRRRPQQPGFHGSIAHTSRRRASRPRDRPISPLHRRVVRRVSDLRDRMSKALSTLSSPRSTRAPQPRCRHAGQAVLPRCFDRAWRCTKPVCQDEGVSAGATLWTPC